MLSRSKRLFVQRLPNALKARQARWIWPSEGVENVTSLLYTSCPVPYMASRKLSMQLGAWRRTQCAGFARRLTHVAAAPVMPV